MKYVSWYDENTFLKHGEVPDYKDIQDRSNAIRQYGIKCVGEIWLSGTGIVPLWEGPEIDESTQEILCLKELENTDYSEHLPDSFH